MDLEQAFIEDILAHPVDPTPKRVFADWLEERGEADLAFAYRWLAARGRHPGSRRRPRARKPWAWWHERSLEMVPQGEHADIRRNKAAVLPTLVFRAFREQDILPAHAYYANPQECVRGLAEALVRLCRLLTPEG